MTMQYINLYNPELRRRREWLTLNNVTLAVLLFSALLLAAGGATRWRTQAMKVELQTLEASLAGQRNRLAQLAAQTGAAAAQHQLANLQQQLAARREVLAALQSGLGTTDSSVGTVGFVDYLRGLARQSVAGLWLTGFSVAQGGVGIEIRGRMTAPDALPDYIRRLNAEKSFQGRQFVSLNVDRPVNKDAAKNDPRMPFNGFVLTAVAVAEAGKPPGSTR